MRRLATVLKDTVSQFWEERAPRMAAALALYTTFSLAPLLIIAVAVAGLVVGQEAAQGRLVADLQWLIGSTGAQAVQELIANARTPASGTLAAVIGVLTLLVGATGVVGELQDSLNTIWNVKSETSGGIVAILKQRLMSFAMILGIGFLLLVSLILSAAVTAVTASAGERFVFPGWIIRMTDLVVSFAAVGALFALIYKIVPDAKIAWADVWGGAAAASLMFALGKFGLSYYVTHSGLESTYGAAGSLVVLLLWVYYSAQILFFGAELTQVVATRRRRPVSAIPFRRRSRVVGVE